MSGSGKYIVVFKDDATDEKIKQVEEYLTDNGGSVTKQFNTKIMKGFSGDIPDSFLQSFQSFHSDVIDYIEPDQTVTTQ